MRTVAATLLLLALALAGCNLAGDITPPAGLATAQAAETLPPATEPATAALPALEATAIPSVLVTEATSSSGETGAIRGVVTNGTSGGTLPGGLEVVLSGFDGEEETYQQSTAVAADGTYSFSDVPVVAGRIYGVTVAHEDVLYFSEGAHLPGGDTPLDLPVSVFDTTTDTAALSVERLHVLFDFSADSRVQVVELWVLSNAGDRTVVAGPSRGAVEVALPEGASDLGFEDGSEGERYVLTDDGFGDTQPIVPGEATSQFIFSYWLPYDGSLAFMQPSGYPVSAEVLLLPQNGVTAQGGGLEDLGMQEIGGQTVHAYSGGAIPAGQALEVELKGKPQAASPSGAASGGWTNAAIGLGVLGMLLIAAGLWWFRPAASGRPRRTDDAAEADVLIGEIAELDDAFAAGGMDEAAYRARRETLKRALRQRMH